MGPYVGTVQIPPPPSPPLDIFILEANPVESDYQIHLGHLIRDPWVEKETTTACKFS